MRSEETSFTATNGRWQAPWHSKSQNRHISSYNLFRLSIHLASHFAQAKQLPVLVTVPLWMSSVLATADHLLSVQLHLTLSLLFPLKLPLLPPLSSKL